MWQMISQLTPHPGIVTAPFDECYELNTPQPGQQAEACSYQQVCNVLFTQDKMCLIPRKQDEA